MPKILHIGQLIGGLDIYIRNTITFSDNRFDFVVVRGEKDNSAPIKKDGKHIKEYQVKLFRRLNPFIDFICLVQIIRIIKKERPNLIHSHSAKGGFVGRVAGFLTNTKTLYTPHAFSFLSTDKKLTRFYYVLMERMLKLNSYLLACSESERQLGIKTIGYKEKKALLWSNAVSDASLYLNDEKSLFNDSYVCYIGRPSYQKNTFFLIDVIKQVVKEIPDFKIYLLGVGHHSPDLSRLKILIKENKLDSNIALVPWVSQNEVLSYVNRARFYLSVSRYEGLPLSVLEAMSLSKPLIVSKVNGNIDCVENGENGYVLPLEPSLFVSKIVEMWNSSEKREYFGKMSKKRFLNDFDVIKRIKYLEKIYTELSSSL
nr:glycosyltransferase [uncultured Carboxylicivirga sp.]